MKAFRQIFCLFLTLVTLFGVLAACGGQGENPTPTRPVTTAGDTTTVPPVTTEPVTTEPVTTEPVTTEPVTTEPPQTEPPCTEHMFAQGVLCTEDRTCVSCGEAVLAGEHTYYNVPCTLERPCRDCGYRCPASEDHDYGKSYLCGTARCTRCIMIQYGDNCRSNCLICNLEPFSVIPFISIGGVSMDGFTIVTPASDPYTDYDYEQYISALMRHQLSKWHPVEVARVSDDVEKSGFEIRIGKTNRTVTQCGENEYIIRVLDDGVEILCDGMYAFGGLIEKVSQLLSTQSGDGLILRVGDVIRQTYETPEHDKKQGDIRVMFHNVYAASKTDELNFLSRYGAFKSLYLHYMPDVVGTQEDMGMPHTVRNYLKTVGYRWIGSGSQQIFYNSNTVELYASDSHGYIGGYGNYGTQWAIFRVKESGKVFGVGTSHFSADSVAGGDPQKGNDLRVGDANSVIQSKSAMLNYAKNAGLEDALNLPLIFGGDYNCTTWKDPITKVIATPGSGLVNIKSVIKDSANKDNYRTMAKQPIWNREFDYHVITPFTPGSGSGDSAIDHIYLYKEGVHYTANQYRIIHSLISRGCADHTPHYVDISFR